MKLLSWILFLFSTGLYADPLSVLIVGGGPAGLATAIEAKSHGCDVTVIEKRSSYTRPQWLFLVDSSVQLFKKWEVDIPRQAIATGKNGKCWASIQIKDLEELLKKRAEELKIRMVSGEFTGWRGRQTALVLTAEKKELALSYDILVGADGTHSTLRKALAIPLKEFDTAFGTCALIPTDSAVELDISPPIAVEEGYLRRIRLPFLNVLFIHFPKEATGQILIKAAQLQGWDRDVKQLVEKKASLLEDVPIYLLQVQRFSDHSQSAILVGDAAASASFFYGMGTNTALKTAEIAGVFFQEILVDRTNAFARFEHSMQKCTDALVENSRHLFKSATPIDPSGLLN